LRSLVVGFRGRDRAESQEQIERRGYALGVAGGEQVEQEPAGDGHALPGRLVWRGLRDFYPAMLASLTTAAETRE
jgi:hypothetical protein